MTTHSGPFRRPSAAVPALALAMAMVLGGSGSLVPVPEIALECLLAVLTAAWVWMSPQGWRQVPRGAWIIAALVVAVPLCQLVPLPPAIWHNLPGRSVEQAALALVGQAPGWRPLSLTPDRTVASSLAMAAAAAVLVMAAAQDRGGRTLLLAVMAAIALLSVVVGAAQMSGGEGNPLRFYNPAESFLDGFQTNHNAAADVLLIGMVALAAVAADWASTGWRPVTRPRTTPEHRAANSSRGAPSRSLREPPPPGGEDLGEPAVRRIALAMVGAASLLLMLGVVLTASRTGIALLPIAIGAQGLILRPWLRLDKRRIAIAGLAVLAGIGIIAAVLGRHGALGGVWGRFHTAGESRPDIWRDAWFALRQYWPWGAGMGSFIPVFAAAERLETVTGLFVNRAHDDYLELVIEAGLPGIAAFALIAWQLARDAWAGWRARNAGVRAQLLCGGASLIILAVHALGDYPLRTISIACMAAVSAGLLLPIAQGAERGA